MLRYRTMVYYSRSACCNAGPSRRPLHSKSRELLLTLTGEDTSWSWACGERAGHVNFMDEVASAMRLVDGIVLVVDVVEGVSS